MTRSQPGRSSAHPFTPEDLAASCGELGHRPVQWATLADAGDPPDTIGVCHCGEWIWQAKPNPNPSADKPASRRTP